MIAGVRHIALLLLALVCANGNSFAKKPSLTRMLYKDSTLFKLHLIKGAHPTIGKTFKIKIHIDLRPSCHVMSSQMIGYDGQPLLSARLPSSLSKDFELVGLKEVSQTKSWVDTSTGDTIIWVSKPFDLIATLKVKDGADASVPLFFYVSSLIVSDRGCRPQTIEVPMGFLGEKPLNLKIARGTKMRKNHLANMRPAT